MHIVTTLPLAVLRIQYTIVRIPLALIDDQLLSRLTPEGPARRLYQRSLDVLDGVVGAVLGETVHGRPGSPHEARMTLVEFGPEDETAEPNTPAAHLDHAENAELNAKAARKLDSDLTAEQIAHIPAAERPTPDVLARLTDAATAAPDIDITPELAHRAAELSHAGTPPSASKIPNDPGFVPTTENH
ncbi:MULTISPECIES: hypothetical protein [unclassified Rhodococcus (in: high G+C Gram-positive bacteria)]|uniref:hypothetical protein n=1 Tax=unclassified Rhodococcus (in: high G+C Gram-positive bacteria) TaxID=192944 RepID=UPI001639D799|nr:MULTISPECIES: hypothetical protein [unclassified Rhodococcus (in: high G+C Gram-positive bacteria)]MBC2642011.1 hypothetical protein [Rhodococcus sp. 3A]MBC2893247.1 hypothetical protein [Rhodococcus sp. 4CII]